MRENTPGKSAAPMMNEQAPLTIVTSIAPFEIAKQQRATDSWRNLGFRVVSLNIESECKSLEPQFPGVEFHRPPRDGTAIAGKPLVYFDDILDWYRHNGEQRICGVVNSDIVMAQVPCAMEVLRLAANGGMVISSRIDVESFDPPVGNWYPAGYDLFFFDRVLLDCYTRSEFMLGMPWWDYWAPSVPLLRGYPVRRLTSPLIYHEMHAINYSKKNHVRFAREYINQLTNVSLDSLTKRLPSVSIRSEIRIDADKLCDEAFIFIRYYSDALPVSAFDVAALELNANWLAANGHQDEASRLIDMAASIATNSTRNVVNA